MNFFRKSLMSDFISEKTEKSINIVELNIKSSPKYLLESKLEEKLKVP